jgi:hypothetical protein
MAVADRSQELFLTSARRGAQTEALHAAVELVLLNHLDLLNKPEGEQDPDLSELAYVYEQLTGFNAVKVTAACEALKDPWRPTEDVRVKEGLL